VLPARPGKFVGTVVNQDNSFGSENRRRAGLDDAGIDNLVYRTGIAVFDRNDPSKLLYRSEQPFSRHNSNGKSGPGSQRCIRRRNADRFLFSYGGADKYVGIAEARQLITK
jgi:hypothetical protein